jgi:hypothetical protein
VVCQVKDYFDIICDIEHNIPVMPQSVLLPIMGGAGITLVLPIMGVSNFIKKLRSNR